MAVNVDKAATEQDLLSIADGEFMDIVMGDYAEIVKVLGIDAALKMYTHFRGCYLNFPKRFYKPEYVISIAAKEPDKRERKRLAILCGYTTSWLERKVKEVLYNGS